MTSAHGPSSAAHEGIDVDAVDVGGVDVGGVDVGGVDVDGVGEQVLLVMQARAMS